MVVEGELLYIPIVVELPEVVSPATLHITIETRDFSFVSRPIYTKYLGGYSSFTCFLYTFSCIYKNRINP